MSLNINTAIYRNYMHSNKSMQNKPNSSYAGKNSSPQVVGFGISAGSGCALAMGAFLFLGVTGNIDKTLRDDQKPSQTLPQADKTLAEKAKGLLPENTIEQLEQCMKTKGKALMEKTEKGIQVSCK